MYEFCVGRCTLEELNSRDGIAGPYNAPTLVCVKDDAYHGREVWCGGQDTGWRALRGSRVGRCRENLGWGGGERAYESAYIFSRWLGMRFARYVMRTGRKTVRIKACHAVLPRNANASVERCLRREFAHGYESVIDPTYADDGRRSPSPMIAQNDSHLLMIVPTADSATYRTVVRLFEESTQLRGEGPYLDMTDVLL